MAKTARAKPATRKTKEDTATVGFEAKLWAAAVNADDFPDFTDFDLFWSWFETEVFDMVTDALDEPLVKGE